MVIQYATILKYLREKIQLPDANLDQLIEHFNATYDLLAQIIDEKDVIVKSHKPEFDFFQIDNEIQLRFVDNMSGELSNKFHLIDNVTSFVDQQFSECEKKLPLLKRTMIFAIKQYYDETDLKKYIQTIDINICQNNERENNLLDMNQYFEDFVAKFHKDDFEQLIEIVSHTKENDQKQQQIEQFLNENSTDQNQYNKLKQDYVPQLIVANIIYCYYADVKYSQEKLILEDVLLIEKPSIKENEQERCELFNTFKNEVNNKYCQNIQTWNEFMVFMQQHQKQLQNVVNYMCQNIVQHEKQKEIFSTNEIKEFINLFKINTTIDNLKKFLQIILTLVRKQKDFQQSFEGVFDQFVKIMNVKLTPSVLQVESFIQKMFKQLNIPGKYVDEQLNVGLQYKNTFMSLEYNQLKQFFEVNILSQLNIKNKEIVNPFDFMLNSAKYYINYNEEKQEINDKLNQLIQSFGLSIVSQTYESFLPVLRKYIKNNMIEAEDFYYIYNKKIDDPASINTTHTQSNTSRFEKQSIESQSIFNEELFENKYKTHASEQLMVQILQEFNIEQDQLCQYDNFEQFFTHALSYFPKMLYQNQYLITLYNDSIYKLSGKRGNIINTQTFELLYRKYTNKFLLMKNSYQSKPKRDIIFPMIRKTYQLFIQTGVNLASAQDVIPFLEYCSGLMFE